MAQHVFIGTVNNGVINNIIPREGDSLDAEVEATLELCTKLLKQMKPEPWMYQSVKPWDRVRVGDTEHEIRRLTDDYVFNPKTLEADLPDQQGYRAYDFGDCPAKGSVSSIEVHYNFDTDQANVFLVA